MKERVQTNKNNRIGCSIVLFIVFLIIFVLILIGLISDNIKTSNQSKHEEKLIEEGKIKSSDEVINEIIEILKNRDKDELQEYLSTDFAYYDNNNQCEYKYLDNFWRDFKMCISSYETEKKDDAREKNSEAYEVYWCIVEANKNIGVDKTDKNYCLQKIRIILKRVVMEDIITYKLDRLVLTNN